MHNQHPRCEQCIGCLSDFDDTCKGYITQRAALLQNSFSSVCGITFTIGGFFQGSERRTVTFTETDAQITVERCPIPPEKNCPLILSLEKEAFFEVLKKIGVDRWAPNYCDPHVMDGTQWELKIRFSDGTLPFESHGSNACPESFKALLALLQIDFSHADGLRKWSTD